jgi:hypothetical protein
MTRRAPDPTWAAVCAWLLLLGLWQGAHGGLLHQTLAPPLPYAGIDPAYWLLHGSGLYAVLARPPVALGWALALAAALVAQLAGRPRAPWLVPLLLVPYGLAFNAAFGFPAHSTYPPLFAAAYGCWAGGRKAGLAAEGFRYVAAFPLASAAAWKLASGALAHPAALADLLAYQHAAWRATLAATGTEPGAQSALIDAIAARPALAAAGLLGVFGLQASFAAAYVTRRLDRAYPWLLAVFVALLWAVMRLDFSGLLALAPFFARRAATAPSPAPAEPVS